jgi:hypothetical protein
MSESFSCKFAGLVALILHDLCEKCPEGIIELIDCIPGLSHFHYNVQRIPLKKDPSGRFLGYYQTVSHTPQMKFPHNHTALITTKSYAITLVCVAIPS